MPSIDEIKASRMYSWVYQPSPEQWSKNNMNKGRGENSNPLFGRVTVRSVKAGQAATLDMYKKAALKLDPTWQASDREPRMETTANPCVFQSVSTGNFQVAIMNVRTVKKEYFVDGMPATPEQLEIIRRYEKVRAERTGVNIQFPYLANLTNVDSEAIIDDAALVND